MKVLIVIDGPDFSENPISGRQWQNERTNLGAIIKLLASRLEMGTSSGTISGAGDLVAHFKIEQSNGEEAAA